MKNAKTNENRILRLTAFLLCMTLLTSWKAGNLYARYTSKSSGGDIARVASFQITGSTSLQDTFAVEIDPETPQEVKAVIKNDSEVSVRYKFDFAVEGNLPLEIKCLNTAAGDIPQKTTEENTWTIDKEAGPNQENTYSFSLGLSDSGYQYSGGVGSVIMTVTSEQID